MKKASKKDVNPQYLSLSPHYARHGQDKFLNEHLFNNKKNGVFVDVGAYDGIESSNSLFFEESNDWSGLCIEPLRNVFPKLKKNRTSHCLNVCCLDKASFLPFQHIIPERRKSLSNESRLSNVEKMSGLVDYSTKEHRQMMETLLQKVGGTIECYDVECIPINNCLELVDAPIDLLTIDTEGSELTILKAIDFTSFSIDVITVEHLFSSSSIKHFLNTKGYRFIKKIGYDSIYKKI